MRDHWNRRRLLRHLGATGIAIGASSMASMPARAASPNDKLNLAIVGCGGEDPLERRSHGGSGLPGGRYLHQT